MVTKLWLPVFLIISALLASLETIYSSVPEPMQTPGECKFGYVKNGDWVIEPKFQEAEPFAGDRAVVMKNFKQGIIDVQGDFIHEAMFDKVNRVSKDETIEDGSNQYFRVFSGEDFDHFKLMNQDGEVVIPGNLTSIRRFNEYEHATIKTASGEEGLIHISGDYWLEGAEEVNIFYQWRPMTLVKKGGKYGLLIEDFEWFMPPDFDSIIVHRQSELSCSRPINIKQKLTEHMPRICIIDFPNFNQNFEVNTLSYERYGKS